MNTSDKRTKQNINAFINGLDKIEKMNPVTFEFNGLGNTITGQTGLGFIAQQVEKVAPYLISKTKEKLRPNDTKSTELLHIHTMGFITLLVNAVKELSQKVKKLEQEIQFETSTKV